MPQRGPIRPFTPRQEEIAVYIARGWSYNQIGAKLHISSHTVAAHVKMMAVLFDVVDADGELGDVLAPRQVVLVYMAYRTERERAARPSQKTA